MSSRVRTVRDTNPLQSELLNGESSTIRWASSASVLASYGRKAVAVNRTKLFSGISMVVVFASTSVAQSLLVLNKEGSVAIVDPINEKVLGSAPTGDGPHEVVATTDGKLAIASNYGSGQMPGHTLSVIDIASRKEIHRVDLA